jgi:hypothetical protein
MIYLTPALLLDGQYDPATDVDGALVAFSVPGMAAPVCDRDNLLFVVVAPAGMSAPLDWQEKTEAEINELYPGTFGG